MQGVLGNAGLRLRLWCFKIYFGHKDLGGGGGARDSRFWAVSVGPKGLSLLVQGPCGFWCPHPAYMLEHARSPSSFC